MAKINVDFQTYFGHPALKQETVGVHRVTINNATTNHLQTMGNLTHADVWPANRTDSVPTFYIGGAGDTDAVNIDGATIGTKYTVVTRHVSNVNTD